MSNARLDILGVRCDLVSLAEVVEQCVQTIDRNQCCRLSMINARKIRMAHEQPLIAEAIDTSHIAGADGVGVILAARLLGKRLNTGRVNGTDLMMALFKEANERGYSIYLLGSTREILNACMERLGTEYSNVKLLGMQDGYFQKDETEGIAHHIRKLKPNILFIGLPSPQKELFARKYQDVLRANIIHGVGGSFDVFAGQISRAPNWMQKFGLEWLHRLLKEPTRMGPRVINENWYMIKLVILSRLFGPKNRLDT
jgi:N-acetylglucosaminyldiphosphoundecaprenol N-acetyl-beta-D-mannosaminyltransferase